MNKIIVPVDGSDAANQAARFASDLARATGAELTLLHVYDAPTAAALGLEAVTPEKIEETKSYLGGGSFKAAIAAIGEPELSVETHTTLGNPGREIVTFAESRGADLIVMGSRGLSGVREWLLGSVSHYVVHHARCPVTIVRPAA